MGPVSTMLMVHGPALFEGAVAVAAVGGAAFGPRLGSAWARTALRRRLRAMGEPAAQLGGARACAAVLEGGIEGDSADGVLVASGYTAKDHPNALSGCASWCAPGVVIVTPHGRVSLEGAARVGAGRTVPNDPRLTEREDEPFERVLTIHDGDRVRVSGVVEPVSARDAHRHGYRDAHTVWRLVPGGGGVIPVLAVDVPAPRVTARARALHGIAAALGAAALIAVGGAAALARADAARGRVTITPSRAVCDGGGAAWGALASLSPFTRRRALDGLRMTFSCKEIRTTEDVLARDLVLRVAARESRDASGLCLERATAFEEAAQYRRAAEVFATCDTPLAEREAARLWVSLGRYDRASALARRWLRGASSPRDLVGEIAIWHLLAGDAPSAAAALERALDLSERGHVGALDARTSLASALDMTRRRANGERGLADGYYARGLASLRAEPGYDARCEDERVMARLDEDRARVDHVLSITGREAVLAAYVRGDVRAVLQALREADEPWTARQVVIGLLRRGLRGKGDRARLRAWAETEFRAVGPDRYDAGGMRWIAGALGHDALLREAREVGRDQCAAERRREADYLVRTLESIARGGIGP